MKAYTDYPIIEFGDTPFEQAPIRMCTIIGYDQDKYCTIDIKGYTFSIKRGYLYITKECKECYSHELLTKKGTIMNMKQNGKGDKNRTVNIKQYNKNYDFIFNKAKNKNKKKRKK